jgi:hypothetical protein
VRIVAYNLRVMSVALVVFVIVASFFVVRVGAILLELTGLQWEQAKFQSLSAFTNSGFTTKEAEDVVKHPVRRRIVTYLIIIGNAGIATTIGAFAGSLMTGNSIGALSNVGIILVAVLIVTWVARRQGFGTRIRVRLEKYLSARYDFQAPSAEDLLRLGEGYVLTRITLPKEWPSAGRPLKELDLKDRLVQVLAIERGARFYPIPGGDDRLMPGDRVVVYGATESIENVFHPETTQRLSLLLGSEGAPVPPARAQTN